MKLPKGKKIAVNIGCDFDAMSVCIGSFDLTYRAYVSRGEFGAEVGVPRVLDLFEKYDIKSTFTIPGHTVDTYPDICKEILTKNNEVCHHGYLHEKIWEPYGMESDAKWWLDSPDGNEIGGSGFSATLKDYARFGQFFLE